MAQDENHDPAAEVQAREGEPLQEMPVLAVRDTVIFPGAMLPITVGRPSSVALVSALGENRRLAVISQTDARVDMPGPNDLYQVGTVCVMHKAIRVPRDNLLLFCEGIGRIRAKEFTATEPFLRARVERIDEIEPEPTAEVEALRRNVVSVFQQIVTASPNLSDELSAAVEAINSAGALADYVAGNLPSLSPAERQQFLEQPDGRVRLNEIHRQLVRELELLELRGRIQSQVQGQLSQNQREFYLREQLKAIQKELGEGEEPGRDAEELRAKLEAAGMPGEVKAEAMREWNRLSHISPASPEYGVARTYLEWMAGLPWSVSSGSQVDVKRAAEILDEDHYDLEKVKDRILDYLAVLQLRPVLKGPILCFVGPPGVGKTSLGKSIARALGRKFARVSMGGMHDEAEIRGHRRTYIGALPGQIIQALRRAGANDPVFMLDEVDKLGRDFRGDPASALLEVLDPEQNNTFRDNYLDVPFDLSKVLFITTANVLDPVPDALRDRMEIIPLEGYTEQEKVIIAFRYLIPRQITENGLDPDDGHRIQRRSRALPDPPLYARGRDAQPGARYRHDLPQAGAAHRRGHAREGGGDARTGGEGPGRAAFSHGHGSGRAHAPAGRGGGAGLDAGGRRRAVHRSRPHAGRQQRPDHDRPVGPGDAGIGAGGAHLGARQRREVRHRPRTVQDQRHSRARARRRHSQGRPFGGHHHGGGAAFHADRPPGEAQPGDDRRDHADRPGAAGGRHQGEGAGRQAQRRARSDHAVRERSQRPGKT